jgi:hypothetical protein
MSCSPMPDETSCEPLQCPARLSYSVTAMSRRCLGWRWPNPRLSILTFPLRQSGTGDRGHQEETRRPPRQRHRWRRKVNHLLRFGKSPGARQPRPASGSEAHDAGPRIRLNVCPPACGVSFSSVGASKKSCLGPRRGSHGEERRHPLLNIRRSCSAVFVPRCQADVPPRSVPTRERFENQIPFDVSQDEPTSLSAKRRRDAEEIGA